jgi:hypothetical protein
MIKSTPAIPEEHPVLLWDESELDEGGSCADSGSAARVVLAMAKVKKKVEIERMALS